MILTIATLYTSVSRNSNKILLLKINHHYELHACTKIIIIIPCYSPNIENLIGQYIYRGDIIYTPWRYIYIIIPWGYIYTVGIYIYPVDIYLYRGDRYIYRRDIYIYTVGI